MIDSYASIEGLRVFSKASLNSWLLLPLEQRLTQYKQTKELYFTLTRTMNFVGRKLDKRPIVKVPIGYRHQLPKPSEAKIEFYDDPVDSPSPAQVEAVIHWCKTPLVEDMEKFSKVVMAAIKDNRKLGMQTGGHVPTSFDSLPGEEEAKPKSAFRRLLTAIRKPFTLPVE